MKIGETKDGFKFEIDENVLEDMELLDALYESQTTNPLRISEVVTKVLGAKQKAALYDYLRDKETGRVVPEKVGKALAEILESLQEGKNS